ncbi:hypothetical protein SDC9_212493 [bioreactor metagenome]|uniref:Uncharacterized protein n=1 Tax=bioreactor metagenome TaxID=1076179 RepID=A0A645JN05_9ZZZZ
MIIKKQLVFSVVDTQVNTALVGKLMIDLCVEIIKIIGEIDFTVVIRILFLDSPVDEIHRRTGEQIEIGTSERNRKRCLILDDGALQVYTG